MSNTQTILEENWVAHDTPRALPVGKGHIHPGDALHAVSASQPTWDSVVSWARRDETARGPVEYSYPRFFISRPIRDLILRVRKRLQVEDDAVSCMILPSDHIANYCAAALRASNQEGVPHIQTARFFLPQGPNADKEVKTWTDFSVVLFPTDLVNESMLVWMDTGSGISTRHAEFCSANLDYLASDSENPLFRTTAPCQKDHATPTNDEWQLSALNDLQEIRERIARLVTSERTELKHVRVEDVLIFPTGMNAIFCTSEALAALNGHSDVIAYGWLYTETVQVLRRSPWNRAISLRWGTDAELDELETMLMKPDHRITALFCEIPSNVKFISPNLERIRSLADKYNFIVACDETAGNFINLDVLPYVDILLSSLTKMFSGASNVTGGSIVVNPNSRHYETIQAQLSTLYKNVYCFPADVAALNRNSTNMANRVHKANTNAIEVVKLLQHHTSVAEVLHPSLGPTAPWYKKHMRRNGGYGNVLSVICRTPDVARRFYDNLDICKGASFGTNFTLATLYVQLACYWNQDKCEQYGLPRHIIRISIGLEDPVQIVSKIRAALDIAGEDRDEENQPV